jgi:hypothetical protein
MAFSTFCDESQSVRKANHSILDKKPRNLNPAGIQRMAAYAGGWTVLLDTASRIVYEIGSRNAIEAGAGDVSSIGRRIAAFVHPDDMVFAVDRMEESLSRPGSEIAFEIRAGSAEGGWRMVDVLAVNCMNDASLDGVILRTRLAEDS